jgi:hypothetical protein
LNTPSSALISGGFDFRRYLYFKRIGAVGFVIKAPEIITQDKAPFLSVEFLSHRIGEKNPECITTAASRRGNSLNHRASQRYVGL